MHRQMHHLTEHISSNIASSRSEESKYTERLWGKLGEKSLTKRKRWMYKCTSKENDAITQTKENYLNNTYIHTYIRSIRRVVVVVVVRYPSAGKKERDSRRSHFHRVAVTEIKMVAARYRHEVDWPLTSLHYIWFAAVVIQRSIFLRRTSIRIGTRDRTIPRRGYR